MYALDREQVEAAHQGFLLALAHRIVEDGKVTRDERALLAGAAAALGSDSDLPTRILDEARTALEQHRSAECLPLPPTWKHGEPLRIGQAVAFTGCDPIERARLEGRAQASGLHVTGSVSTRTAMLVTDGANPQTRKARKARELGTRFVTPKLFTVLLDHLQPALTAANATQAPDTAQGVPHGVRADDDPATVRAWARANGLPVGVRGRISAEVVTAYHAHTATPAHRLGS
jgi:DNA polymerase-3 subunit epsilon